MRRTRTFVSTARMPFLDVPSNTFFEFAGCTRSPGSVWKHSPMNVFGVVPPGTADNDSFSLFFPLQNGAGTDTQFPADFQWHRGLSLRCNLRLGEWHNVILPR